PDAAGARSRILQPQPLHLELPAPVRRPALGDSTARPRKILIAASAARCCHGSMSRQRIGLATAVVVAIAVTATILGQQPPIPTNPRTARDWRQVGAARRQAKDYDGAIAAFQAALKLEPDAPAAMFALGAVYAAKRDTAEALEWLTRARATRRVDMTQIEADNDLKPLVADPRFAALLPTPEDFEHPFVEPVSMLREWDGEAMNDQFGWIARNIGDVDGAGTADIVTSAPTKEIRGANAGRVYVYSTGTKRLLW